MTSDVHVIRAGAAAVVDRNRGVRTTHLVTTAQGATSFVNGITELEAGASLPFHFHNCDESVVVLQGVAAFEVEGQTHELGPDDATLVPAGVAHRFANPGSGSLRLFFTYGSAQPTRTMADSGETVAIGSPRDRLDP